MRNHIKTFTLISLAASAAAMIAVAQPRDDRSPDGLVRAYLAGLPEFQSGDVVLDEAEIVSGWDTAPKRFAVVRTFARRLDPGGQDRGQHELVLVHEDIGVIGVVEGFSSAPRVRHDGRMLRVSDMPPIPLATPRDVFKMAGGAHASEWVLRSALVEYGKMAAEQTLGAYERQGRDWLDEQTTSAVLGSELGSPRESACGVLARSGISISKRLPEKIVAFMIEESTLDNARDPNLVMSKIWETAIDATITDVNGVEHRVQILVVGDPCDRDRICQVVIE